MNDKRFQRKLEKIKKRGEQYKKEKKLRDTYAKYLPEKKKKKVSNIMLITIVIAIVGYVIADFVLQYKTGIEISPTVTTCWFAFWTTEIIALTGIKVSKVKNNYDNTSYTSENYQSETIDCSDDEVCG